MQEKSLTSLAERSAISRRTAIKSGLLAGLGLTAMPSLLASCSSDTSGGSEDNEDRLVVGLSLGTLAQRRWQFDKQYMEEYAEELGITLLVQSANDDTQLQINQVEDLLAQNIDVLILSPIDVKTSAPSVVAAKSQGVPVISYNSIIEDADIDFWIARDNVAVGVLQAEQAVAAVPAGNYLIISGEGGVDIAQQKTEGNMQVLQPYIDSGEINLVSQRFHSGWDPASGLAQLEDALGVTSNSIDAVLCNYDGFVVSSLPALDSAGLLGTTWLGGEDVFPEVAQAIVRGEVAMSAFTPLRELAQTAIEAAAALGQGETPESDATVNNGAQEVPGREVLAVAVTEDNMREFLEETRWLEEEEVFPE